jgi:hypothetical protein
MSFMVSKRCRALARAMHFPLCEAAREQNVLKITVEESPTENRWILQGQSVGLWVRELRSSWKKKHLTQSVQRCVIDLTDVTAIDKKGEKLLPAMFKEGAELIATGIYTKHMLEKVKATRRKK